MSTFSSYGDFGREKFRDDLMTLRGFSTVN
jgi:hypothetical protein